jgi:hypothetical protein
MDNSKDLNLKAKYEQLYWGEFVAPIKGAYWCCFLLLMEKNIYTSSTFYKEDRPSGEYKAHETFQTWE